LKSGGEAPTQRPEIRTEVLQLAVLLTQPQPRTEFDPAKLELLAESLKVRQIHPIVVYEHPDTPGVYVVIDGERRLRAARMAMLPSLEARIVPRPEDRLREIEWWMIDDSHKEKLGALDQASLIDEWLRISGKKQKDAAKRFAYSQATVSKLANLPHNLANELHAACEAGTLGVTFWLEITRLKDHAQQREAYEFVKSENACRETLKRWVDAKLGKKAKGEQKAAKLNTRGGIAFILPAKCQDFERLLTELESLKAAIAKCVRNGLPFSALAALLANPAQN
jgi:ParB/RepB/Spo0J family partition protein